MWSLTLAVSPPYSVGVHLRVKALCFHPLEWRASLTYEALAACPFVIFSLKLFLVHCRLLNPPVGCQKPVSPLLTFSEPPLLRGQLLTPCLNRTQHISYAYVKCKRKGNDFLIFLYLYMAYFFIPCLLLFALLFFFNYFHDEILKSNFLLKYSQWQYNLT